MDGRTGWLLYADEDYALNRDFASMMEQEGQRRRIAVKTVLLSQWKALLAQGEGNYPGFVISRQRDASISRHLENLGIPVYNNAKVCEVCNDKRNTHHFLQGLPMLKTWDLGVSATSPPQGTHFPVILKPACSHGGDRVLWVETPEEWAAAASRILPEPLIQQEIASDYGRDLRIYVVFGQIIAAVMRTAKEGFISNYKRGGQVALHRVTPQERWLLEQVIAHFSQADAPLCFAGVDFLYDHGEPVVSEVEDVVGSRMLYQVSDLHIAGIYWDGLAKDVQNKMHAKK